MKFEHDEESIDFVVARIKSCDIIFPSTWLARILAKLSFPNLSDILYRDHLKAIEKQMLDEGEVYVSIERRSDSKLRSVMNKVSCEVKNQLMPKTQPIENIRDQDKPAS